jgi:concentrative nucleoside transporter, CNT family
MRMGLIGRPVSAGLVALWLGLMVTGALFPAQAEEAAPPPETGEAPGDPAPAPDEEGTADPALALDEEGAAEPVPTIDEELAADPDDATPDAPVVVDPTEPAEPMRLSDLRAEGETTTFLQRLMSAVGLGVMVLFGWLLSTNRKVVPWRVLAWGVGMQLVFALFILKTKAGQTIFAGLNTLVVQLLAFTNDGAAFIFGDYLTMTFSFALNVLPTIIFFSALMTVLYHIGIMQFVVKGFAWVMQRTMGTSGSESLSAAANIFVGQTEAPLVVKPFVGTMTRSELMAIMCGGFATVAGGVMAAYVGMLEHVFADIAGHLIAASVMSAPAALVIAKMMVPETEVSKTAGELKLEVERPDANVIDAAARGAGEGLRLALNVAAMLLAFLALVAMFNYLLAMPAGWYNASVWVDVKAALEAGGHAIPEACEAGRLSAAELQQCIAKGAPIAGLDPSAYSGWTPLSIQRILSWVFWPVAWVMGVPAQDCAVIARLLGEKMVLNEFVAYLSLGSILSEGTELSYRSVVIATYALCGFANFGSIAIQIGGISGIAPERRGDLARLGLRAMIGGTLAAFMTATIAGMLI